MRENKKLLSDGESKCGRWIRDEYDLPCFELDLDKGRAPYYPFAHLMSTGHISVLVNQWGNVNFLTTEGGTTSITPCTGRTRSGLYAMFDYKGSMISLLHSELNINKKIRYGIGYAEFYGEIKIDDLHLSVSQKFMTPNNRSRGFLGYFTVSNLGANSIAGRITVRSDIQIKPVLTYDELLKKLKPEYGDGSVKFAGLTEELGDIYLVGEEGWRGNTKKSSLALDHEIELKAGEAISSTFCVGYGKNVELGCVKEYLNITQQDIHDMWKQKLSVLSFEDNEKWIRDECLWSIGQLLSFENYDSSVDEYFITLGGYGFFSNPDEPCYSGFGVREACETALVLSGWYPDLAKSSLRWVAKTQLSSGDIPKGHSHRREKDIEKLEIESDTEIWFVMACCEYIKVTEDYSFFDEVINYWDDGKGTMWEHIVRAYNWIKDGIGTGSHNLILIKEGDWNDYLSTIGAGGKGESIMNSAMACKALRMFCDLILEKSETELYEDAKAFLNKLQEAMSGAFDEKWFVRAYCDDGAPVGTFREDRVFLNAQSWAAIGKCGTDIQRRKALMSAVDKCHTDIGMTLMSRPYSSPAPSYISSFPIPAGEGENAGIWPQTVHWMIWALAEEGLVDVAQKEWECMSLRNHMLKYPEVPFGIYNGPDCYSSKFAGQAEGWTQVQVFNRMVGTPMNPIIAWQAFTMKKINEAKIVKL